MQDMKEAKLQNASLLQSIFSGGTDLAGAVFAGAALAATTFDTLLNAADLSSCIVESVIISNASISFFIIYILLKLQFYFD